MILLREREACQLHHARTIDVRILKSSICTIGFGRVSVTHFQSSLRNCKNNWHIHIFWNIYDNSVWKGGTSISTRCSENTISNKFFQMYKRFVTLFSVAPQKLTEYVISFRLLYSQLIQLFIAYSLFIRCVFTTSLFFRYLFNHY